MRGVVVEKIGVVTVKDDIPKPNGVGPYEALVKIVTCGFCNGTDMRIIDGQMTEIQGAQPYPLVLGHEAAGIVEAVGDKVRNYAVGEKHIRVNGNGVARDGRYFSMHGQMVEYGIITDYAAMEADGVQLPDNPFIVAAARMKPSRLPDDFDLVDAGVLLPLCECLSAVRNFDINENTDVLIYGAGPMGLAMMQYMHIVGAKSVVAIDSVPERLQKALDIAKVNEAYNFMTDDIDKVLEGRLFDRVVDAVGLSSVLMEGSKRLRPFGMLCSLGVLKKGDSSIDLSFLKNNTRLQMLNFPYQEYAVLEENIRYIKEGKIDPKDYYSHVLPIEEVNKAIELVRNKETIKVIMTL